MFFGWILIKEEKYWLDLMQKLLCHGTMWGEYARRRGSFYSPEWGLEFVIYGWFYAFFVWKLIIMCHGVVFHYFSANNVQRSVVPLVKPHNFIHPDDHLVLEDESGRVKLSGYIISPSEYVTGLYDEQFILIH